jgi:hypothetical protein
MNNAKKAQNAIFVRCDVVNVQHNTQKSAYLGEKLLAAHCCVLAESRQLLSFPGEVKLEAHGTNPNFAPQGRAS